MFVKPEAKNNFLLRGRYDLCFQFWHFRLPRFNENAWP